MNFVVDIGNSNTVIGLYKGDVIIKRWRIATERSQTVDDLTSKIHSLMSFSGISTSDISQCVISSVVPTWNHAWERFSIEFLNRPPLFITSEINSGIELSVDNPGEVGADRIANAVAASKKFSQGAFIVDSGTAITLDIITPDRKYIGGAIMPGIIISMDALSKETAKLPRFELTMPEKPIGTNTLEGLKSGVFYGFVGMIDRVIEESLTQIDFKPEIIATGGLAGAIKTGSKYISRFERDLTLEGLNYIAARYRGKM